MWLDAFADYDDRVKDDTNELTNLEKPGVPCMLEFKYLVNLVRACFITYKTTCGCFESLRRRRTFGSPHWQTSSLK